MALIIRPARRSDLPDVGHLWELLVDYHRQLDVDLPQAARDGSQRYIIRLEYGLDRSDTCVFVAVRDEQVVGYVYGTIIDLLPEMFERETAGMIADIFVHPDHRRRGIGERLVQAMRDWFALREVDHYEWYVAAQNKAGISFWQAATGARPLMIRMRAAVPSPVDE